MREQPKQRAKDGSVRGVQRKAERPGWLEWKGTEQ